MVHELYENMDDFSPLNLFPQSKIDISNLNELKVVQFCIEDDEILRIITLCAKHGVEKIVLDVVVSGI